AFVVAGATRADLLNDLRIAVEKGIERGATLEQFRRDFKAIVKRRGWTGWTGEGSPDGIAWRTRVIWQTNLRTSFAAGRYAQLTDADVRAALPYWKYIHSDLAVHPRPIHKRWGDSGLTLPVDHPFWQTNFPPNGYGCGCRVVGVPAPGPDDATEPPEGWDTVDEETGTLPGVDKGWAYAPGSGTDMTFQEMIDKKLITYPPAIAEALMAEIGPYLERLTPPAPVAAAWDSATPAGKWHDAAFSLAPADILRTIARIGDPKRLLQTPGVTAECARHVHIDMDGHDIKSLHGQSVWRHEYGHHVDGSLSATKGYFSEEAAFLDAMDADKKLLLEGAAAGRAGAKTQARRAALDAIEMQTYQDFVTAPDRAVWLVERYQRAGLDYAATVEAMEKHAMFPSTLSGLGLENRYRRIVVAFEQRDAQALMDAITGGFKTQESRDAFRKGTLGHLSDLFGSVTRNKVSGYYKSGWGHMDAYYRSAGFLAGTEAFANLFALYGEGGLFFRQVLEQMFPALAGVFKGAMK
ncbi:MAG: phage head morphogenesis protein, partial [Azoarcus sp.]|nr:phage head morphogenesis protein [Azoarcus sp.]